MEDIRDFMKKIPLNHFNIIREESSVCEETTQKKIAFPFI